MFAKENPFADYKNYLEEKALSKAQQRLMGQALAYKRGDLDDASDEVKKLANSMSEKDLEDFAKTKHKGLPDRVGENASADYQEEDNPCWDGYKKVPGKKDYEKGSCVKEENELQEARGEALKAFESLVKRGGIDRTTFQKAHDLYKATKFNELKKLIRDADTDVSEAIADLIQRHDPRAFNSMYPRAKSGDYLRNIVKEAKEVHIRLDHLDGDNRKKQIKALLQRFEDEGTIEFSGETDKGVLFNLNKPANLRSMNKELQKVFSGAMFEDVELDEITFHQGIGSGGDEVMKQLLKILKKSGKAPDIQKRLERELKNTDKKEEVDLDEAKKGIKKLDKETMDMLRSLDDEEARLIIQGLPSSLRRAAMKELGIKEKVDGRTTAYKETASRLLKMKGEAELDEAGYKVPKNYAAMMAKKRRKAGTSEFGTHPDKKKDVKKEEVELDEADTYAIYKKGKVFDTFKSKEDAHDSLDSMDLSPNSKKDYRIRKLPANYKNDWSMKEEVFEEVDLEEEFELTERKAFIFAAAKAKANGKKTFEFNGKEYKMTMKKGPVVEADPPEEDDEEVVKESTKEYAKSLQQLADKAKKDKISSNDLLTLSKLAQLMKKANEELEEKKGLWANIHAKRKRGERPAKPGEKGYPKTLDIEDETDLEEAGYMDHPKTKEEIEKKYPNTETDVKNKNSRDLQSVKEDGEPSGPTPTTPAQQHEPDDGITDDERKFLKKYGLKRSELKIYRKVEALKNLKK